MSQTNDWIAHVIAFDYGFHPHENGKYEPGADTFNDRWIRIAHLFDATNVLILFDQFELVPDGT